MRSMNAEEFTTQKRAVTDVSGLLRRIERQRPYSFARRRKDGV